MLFESKWWFCNQEEIFKMIQACRVSKQGFDLNETQSKRVDQKGDDEIKTNITER